MCVGSREMRRCAAARTAATPHERLSRPVRKPCASAAERAPIRRQPCSEPTAAAWAQSSCTEVTNLGRAREKADRMSYDASCFDATPSTQRTGDTGRQRVTRATHTQLYLKNKIVLPHTVPGGTRGARHASEIPQAQPLPPRARPSVRSLDASPPLSLSRALPSPFHSVATPSDCDWDCLRALCRCQCHPRACGLRTGSRDHKRGPHILGSAHSSYMNSSSQMLAIYNSLPHSAVGARRPPVMHIIRNATSAMTPPRLSSTALQDSTPILHGGSVTWTRGLRDSLDLPDKQPLRLPELVPLGPRHVHLLALATLCRVEDLSHHGHRVYDQCAASVRQVW